jgi:hypothetical protein
MPDHYFHFGSVMGSQLDAGVREKSPLVDRSDDYLVGSSTFLSRYLNDKD